MEDQGKRLLLAVVVAFGIMMVWTMLFPPKKSEKKQESPAVTETTDQSGDGGVAPAETQPGAKPAEAGTKPGEAGGNATAAGAQPGEAGGNATAAGAQPAEAGGEATAAGAKPAEAGGEATAAGAKPTTAGGEATPAAPVEPPRGEEHFVRFEFKRFNAVFSTYSAGLTSWELLGKKFRDRDAGGTRQTDLAPTGDENRFPPGDIDLYPFTIGFSKSSDLQIPARTEWTVERQTDTEVDFAWSSPELRVVKKFRFIPDDYLLELTVEIENLSELEAKQELVVSSFGFQDPAHKGGGRWTRVDTSWRTACDVGGEVETNSAKYLARGPQAHPGHVKWAGFMHSYFLAAYSPRADVEGQFDCVASLVKDAPVGTMRVDLTFGPPTKLRPHKHYARMVTAYFGPKYLHKLDSLSDVVGYDTGFEESVNLGFFAIISRPLLWLLAWFQSFVVNWGVAIILLTIVVKLATLYWTTKSMRSMKAMADLKPEVEKIQKKYKDDKQRQQVEIMAMYKANKVSPLSGCLPMLLQMPIWFALYRTLMVAAELYQAPFIPGWIDDLTAPDPIYVMPVALMGMMFVQAKLSPSTADSTQQKIMMYGMPLMFGVFSFFFPAGLTLYIFTNTCLTAVHHVWMNETDKKKKAAEARATGVRAQVGANDNKSDDADLEHAAGDDDDGDDGDEGGSSARNQAGKGGAQARKSKGAKSRKRGAQKKKSGRRKRSA